MREATKNRLHCKEAYSILVDSQESSTEGGEEGDMMCFHGIELRVAPHSTDGVQTIGNSGLFWVYYIRFIIFDSKVVGCLYILRTFTSFFEGFSMGSLYYGFDYIC